MPSDERPPSERTGTPVDPSEKKEGERSEEDEDSPQDAQGDERATRDYPTRDCPPAAFEGTASEWSALDEEDRRIEVFVMLPVEDRDPAILVPTGGKTHGGRASSRLEPGGDGAETTLDGVTAAECREIREKMGNALTAREVVEAFGDYHTSKIMRHAYGECNHSVEVPATASPQIGPDECLAMRDDYRQGDSVAAIASTWARSENTVTRHIFGRCSHDPRPRDRSPSRITVPACGRIRRTFEGNQKVSVREVACAMRLREEVVATHLFDYCRHTGNDPPEEDSADPGDAELWDGRNA